MLGVTRSRNHTGQAMTESVMLMPLYFLIVFALLQVGQLGAALLVVEYGASTVARQASQDEDPSVVANASGSVFSLDTTQNYKQKFVNLFVAGMQYAGLTGKIKGNGSTTNIDPAATLTVNACAKVNAFPFLGN